MASFDDLLAEGAAVPTAGWDFSWFDGRASEERPPWGYARLLGERMSALAGQPGAAALDLQTGGGEVLATVPAAPPVLVATECWPPNVAVARRNLARLGGRVVPMRRELDDLPFTGASFDLVTSRHPVAVRWDEVARVLKPGGTYFSQDVGDGSVRELTEFMMGPQPRDDGPNRAPKWSVRAAVSAGLEVVGPARVPRPDGVRRRRGRRALPAQGHLDRARLHRGRATRAGCARCTSRSRSAVPSWPPASGS